MIQDRKNQLTGHCRQQDPTRASSNVKRDHQACGDPQKKEENMACGRLPAGYEQAITGKP